MTTNGYTFAEYTLRAAGAADRAHLETWIAADPDHRGRVAPEFFFAAQPGVECYVLEDRHGEPVFYFRMSRALRVDIQFRPSATPEERAANATANAAALSEGFGWLSASAQKAGFRELLFQSTVGPLIRYCEKRLGFQRSEHELVCRLPGQPQAEEQTVQPQHQHAAEEL